MGFMVEKSHPTVRAFFFPFLFFLPSFLMEQVDKASYNLNIKAQ